MGTEDMAAALVRLRGALDSLLGPEDAGRFTEVDLRLLWEGGYVTLKDLEAASHTGLLAANLKPARADQIIKAQLNAPGWGVESTTGAGAPAPARLVDSAAKLHYACDGTWRLHYNDVVVPYVDGAGVVGGIRSWVRKALLNAAVYNRLAPEPYLLVVSGLVKTGKSHTLEHMVPAVLAEALREQGEEGPLAGMVVLRLKADQLARQRGAAVMLRSLLRILVIWALQEHVPMREGAVQAAQDVVRQPLDPDDPDMPGQAIHEFLKAVEVPVLVLFDEVQSLFLPTIGGKLDVDGAGYIRDTFLRLLLVYGPHTILWCLTGSSMARTWVTLADIPPNGYTVILGATTVNLPATYCTEHMSLVWRLLQDSVPEKLNRKLFDFCPPSVALLAFVVRLWIQADCPTDVAAFIRELVRTKIIDESLKEWKVGLEAMPSSQRIAVLDMSFPGVGAKIDTDLHSGLRRFLAPHLDRTVDGRYYFRDAYQRQIVRLLFNKDGTLRTSWSELEFSATLTQLDSGWNLLYLGEVANYLLGPGAWFRLKGKKPPAGMDEFKARLQAIADEIAKKLAVQGGPAMGPQELWEKQPWFQKVLESEWNSSDRSKYQEKKKKQRTHPPTHLSMLVFYLRLSRNVLAHSKPWDREDGVTVDVNVIEALPSVLGQSLLVFNDVMVEALRLLSRQTVAEAAAEFEAQLSGSDDSLEGLAEDEDSSSGGLGSGSSSSGGRESGVRAMADKCAPARPGPAAGCGQRAPLVYIPGRHGVRGQGGPRAATLAPRLRGQRSLFAPSAAVRLWLP